MRQALADAAITFAASTVYVGLKAFQQLNVVERQYLAVWPTSVAMAVLEVTLVVRIARAKTALSAIPLGLGAATGCTLAMLVCDYFL